MTVLTGEAIRMKLASRFCLEELALDAFVAPRTDGIVQFVVVTPTVRMIPHHIEICCLERVAARLAHETSLVVPS